MSDDSAPPKPPAQSIPSWQRAATTASKPESEQPASTPTEATLDRPSEEQMTVAERAVKWLEEPSIRTASRERKVAFLLSKGVARDDIDRLLPKTAQQPLPAQEELKTVHESQGAEKAPVSPAASPAPAAAQPQPPRSNVPPVITYPEFLLQPQDKPPIVTTQRLVNTAYVAGGLIATLYGVSQYVVAPMAESLTAARLTFMEHTAAQVDELNSRLEANVSKVPVTVAAAHKQSSHRLDEEPPSPTDSDPTELYHRDIGTQTTPELTTLPQTDASSDNSSPNDEELSNPVSLHEARLRSINEQVAGLRASTDSHADGALADLKTTVAELTQYLTDTSYNSPYYGMGYNSGMDGSSGAFVGGAGSGGADASGKDKRDAVDALKADIRSVKGVLLSARNFPAGRSMAAGR